MKAPQRGEVWLVDLGLAAKVRPALVVSVPADDTDRALVTIVPHTTSARGTIDLDFADIPTYPPAEYVGLVVLDL